MRMLDHLLVAISFVRATAALGINCRGSGLCPLATFENILNVNIAQGLRDGIYSTTFSNDTVYNSGDHVICVSSSVSISIGVGIDPEAGPASVDIGLDGRLGSGGICVFPQYLAQPLTLGTIKTLANALLQHGCKTCGSVPVHFVDQGSNDPGEGILTWNYVSNPDCVGNCISAADQPSSSDSTNTSGSETGETITVTQAAQTQASQPSATTTGDDGQDTVTITQAQATPSQTTDGEGQDTVTVTQAQSAPSTTLDNGEPGTVTVTASASTPPENSQGTGALLNIPSARQIFLGVVLCTMLVS